MIRLSKAALRRLYAELPALECQRRCHAYCGPVAMSESEWELICRHLGRVPEPSEADWESLTCPMLREGRCTVYQVRPMLCRLWGLVEGLECPHGCRPSPRYLTAAEGHEFLRRTGAYE